MENAERRAAPHQLTFWDVGQGDFITYSGEHQCFVFDAGGSIRIPVKDLLAIKNLCFKKYVRIFISHFDKDHIVNTQRLLRYLPAQDCYFSHLDPRSQLGQKLLSDLKFLQVAVHEIRSGYFLPLKNGSLRCIWPPRGALKKAENDRSLVFILKDKRKSFLLTGDLPSKLERKLNLEKIGILKAGHHGSKHSSSTKFLNLISPLLCIVSVGRDNKYGHPHSDALQRMALSHCAILRTDQWGSITIEI